MRLWKTIAAFFLLILITNALFSKEKMDYSRLIAELKKASLIENPMKRLAEYDSILQKYKIKSVPSKIIDTNLQNNSKWYSVENTDPIDDSRIIVFNLSADTGQSEFGMSPELFIRFKGTEKEVYINWFQYLGNDASASDSERKFVDLRLGKNEATKSLWTLSTDSKATFYPNGTVELIHAILSNGQLIARCTPYNSSPITAVFDIKGLRQEMEKYTNLINWDKQE